VRILAIETATSCVACALWSEDGPVASFALGAGQRHAEMLMPAVDDLCRRAGWSVADLEGVAVDVGPGLFTGLRVGLATATTIATARGVPAVGVTSLEALAYPYRRRPGLLAPVVDARRGEVYWSLYESAESNWGKGGAGAVLRERRPPAVAGPEVVAAELASLSGRPSATPDATLNADLSDRVGAPVLALGDGAWRYRDVFAAASTEVAGPADRWPSPLAVAELGHLRLLEAQSHGGTTAWPQPLYLRHADVRIGWEEVGGRVAGPRGPAPQNGAGAASPSSAPKLAP
jgi:tRNA threonylcarbamoyladenosine biosynthesis protein TsaB